MTCTAATTCVPQADRCMSVGASDIFTVTIEDETGTPLDITGYTVRYTVRKSVPAITVVDDTDAAISAIATISVGTDGVASFNVPPEDTVISVGTYFYDIKMESPAGDETMLVGGDLTAGYTITKD